MTQRSIIRTIKAIDTSDGAGVRLRRSLGSTRGLYADPFLLLDEFSSDDPDDYSGGFPPHPHRGFETVTYMLDGHMRHEDHLGNRGDLGPGSVQWMCAGHGIIHSEMPQQQDGRMRGFQLWINLPAAEKMQPPTYRDIPAGEIPQIPLALPTDQNGQIRLVAGSIVIGGERHSGPINPDSSLSTDPLFFDVELAPNSGFSLPLPAGHTVILYPYEGSALIGKPAHAVPAHTAALLSDQGDAVTIQSGPTGCRALLLAGKPIGEPIVQYGPFVMNSQAEIEQAIADYRNGTLTRAL